MQVSKALLYHQPKILEMVEKASKFASMLITLRPVTVFDGHIYVYEHDTLSRVPEVLYRFRYTERFFLIEIITKDFFGEY